MIPDHGRGRERAAATARHGTSFPLGATVFPDGVNFSVFSRQATRIELLLFDGVDQAQPGRVIELERALRVNVEGVRRTAGSEWKLSPQPRS